MHVGIIKLIIKHAEGHFLSLKVIFYIEIYIRNIYGHSQAKTFSRSTKKKQEDKQITEILHINVEIDYWRSKRRNERQKEETMTQAKSQHTKQEDEQRCILLPDHFPHLQ